MAEPASVQADGNVKATWVAAIADTGAPSAAELNATTAVDLSCYLTADGLTMGGDEQSITDDRFCSRQTFTRPGRFNDTLDLMYVYRPQDSAAADNKAYSTLKHLTNGFVVLRWGEGYETAYAAGDVVDVYPVQLGRQMKATPEANSVLKVSQSTFVTAGVQRDEVVTI